MSSVQRSHRDGATARSTWCLLALLATFLVIAAFGCGSDDPTPTATAIPTPVVPNTATPEPQDRFTAIEPIVDSTNFNWPRTIRTDAGTVILPGPPQRVHFASLGHAEIGAALVGTDPFAASYAFFKDPNISNIWDLLDHLEDIGSEPEEVIALQPELVIASQFTNPDLVAVVADSGIPVIRVAEEGGSAGDVENVLLMGYILGVEQRAIQLASEIERRLAFVRDRTTSAQAGGAPTPNVLAASRYFDIYTSGGNTNHDEIITAAGGINSAKSGGIDSFQQVSIESLAALKPDVIIVTQPEDSGAEFRAELLTSPVLTEVPAIINGAVHPVNPAYFSTLSHWNVRGIEQLAAILYPDAFADVQFEDFPPYQP